MKVLVIDDSDLARTHVRRLLHRVGMVVFEQPSAIGATRSIIQNGIEAVVVDVSMPGLSGEKLVGVLRKNPRLRDLVVVIISAKSWDELEEVAGTCGADALLPKDRVEVELPDLLRQLHLKRCMRRSAIA